MIPSPASGQTVQVAAGNENQRAALEYVLNAVSRSPLLFRLPPPDASGATAFHPAQLCGSATDLPEYLEIFAELRALYPYGAGPYRADWLVVQLSRPPYYYRAAGVPATRAEYEKLLGLDDGEIARLAANRGANLFRSAITRKPRRLSRWQGPLGGAWNTYDVSETSLRDPRKDPFRDPGFAVGFDAGEHIAAKANGLHLYALYDAQGKRADAVPADIAHDDSEPLGDGLVTPMVSCVRCHVEDGLRGFGDQQTALLAGPAALYAADAGLLARLAAFYGRQPKLQRELARDREDLAAAVLEATGLPPKEASAALAAVVREYQYEPVTPAKARSELGLAASALADSALDPDRAAAADLVPLFAASTDPILLALASGLSVQRAQWELSYREAALLAAAAE